MFYCSNILTSGHVPCVLDVSSEECECFTCLFFLSTIAESTGRHGVTHIQCSPQDFDKARGPGHCGQR